MKQANMTAWGITFLLAFASPSYSRPDNKGTVVEGTVHWVNLDGSRGMTGMSAALRNSPAWTNPDGTHGFVEQHSALAPTINYAWANPDGYGSASMKAVDAVDHGGFANRMNVSRSNDPKFHEVPRGDEPMSRVPLLGMLVGALTIWLVRQLWPE